MSYPIQVVAHKTGLSQATLRAWERRYSGVRPDRDAQGRRVYSEELTEKLSLLAGLVDTGYRISQVVSRDLEELRELARELDVPAADELDESADEPDMDTALRAVENLDDRSLYRILEKSISDRGRLDLIDGFVFPLEHEVQRRRDAGSLKDMHLSFLKTSLRTVLAQILVSSRDGGKRPVALLSSPIGHDDDMGLVASAIHAHAAGWRPLLLGAGIPAEEAAQAAAQVRAGALIIGVGSRAYDLSLVNELVRTRNAVPEEIPVFFGGRLPRRLVEDVAAAGLSYLHDMNELRSTLEHFAQQA